MDALGLTEGVRTAGRALMGVIDEILDFSKIESGRLELEEIDFDLVDLVESVAELVGEPAQAKGLELLAYCSPELPTGLRGDPARIRQETVTLTGNRIGIVEQNFDLELLTPATMMQKAVGETVTLVRINPASGAETRERARILAANCGVVMQIGDRIEVLRDDGLPTRVIFDPT